jgi:hypothetical protein
LAVLAGDRIADLTVVSCIASYLKLIDMVDELKEAGNKKEKRKILGTE